MTSAGKLGIVCAALVVGEALGFAASGVAAVWPLVGFAAGFTLVFGFGRSWRLWPVVFFLLLGLTLAFRAADARHRFLVSVELASGPYAATFVVRGEPQVRGAVTNGVRWVSFPTVFPAGRLNVVFAQPLTAALPQVGERWSCAGWLERRSEGDTRARRLWVKGSGTRAVRVAAADPLAPSVLLARLRRELSRRLGLGLETRPQVAALSRAMVLGERTALPHELRETFAAAGTMHVFAISGLHVMLVAQVLLYALVLTLFPIRWAGLALFPALGAYVLMIGASPSAVRAAAMTGVCWLAPVFWRRPDSLAAWEVTVIGFALSDPIGFFGVGSLLSFTVMLGILLFLRWAKPFGSRALTDLGLPFAAWAAGVPITAHVFGAFTPGGLVANLVTVPLAGAAVLTSVLALAAGLVSERLAAHVNNLAALFVDAMVGVSWAVAHLPGGNVRVAPWPLATCAAWYVGLTLAFVWVKMVWARRRAQV